MQGQYGDHYQKIERVGNGTYGVIFKVKSIPEDNICIAKHIPLHNLDKTKALQEFKILEKLRHRYIVRSIDCFQQEDELILIMEYCGEKDLAWHIDQRRKSGKHFSQFLVTNWILQLLLAVGFMHSNKIVHRDIKPQNIFVDSDMNLKVGDFGISKLLDYTAQNCQTSAGTPSYMAPEMVDSQDYSFKADIWSLGCVIYEICTLERLFPVKDAQDKPIGLLKMMDMIKNKEINAIPSIYSEDLRKLVKKMLNRTASKRPLTSQLLKDKFLVHLMINTINQKDSLKNQYAKGQEAPSLSNSMLDRQAESVKEQLKKLSVEVGEKMSGMKNKKVEKNQLENYEKELKLKMKEVQNAVKAAFDQLYKNGKFPNQAQEKSAKVSKVVSKIKNSSIKMPNDSLQNSSDMTIQSVQLNSKKSFKNDSELSLVQSGMVSSLGMQSKSNRFDKSASRKMQKTGKGVKNMEDFQATVNSEYADTMQNQLDNTLQSAYQQSIGNPQALEATIHKLDAMRVTLQKNPEAVLGNSFLDCTLQLSGDKSLPRKLKESPFQVSGSVQFDLTKREQPQNTQKPNFQKKKESPKYEQEDYEQDFQEYNQNLQINNKRQSQLEAMLSLYQQQLSRQDSLSGQSQGFKQRQKYLVMSEIKEHSIEEGSSIRSSNASSFE